MTHELLIEKGFKLNEFAECEFYNFITKDINLLKEILLIIGLNAYEFTDICM